MGTRWTYYGLEEQYKEGAKELREDLASFAIDNLHLFGGVVFATEGHDAPDLVQYVKHNIDPLGKYGGDVELRLLVHMLGRPINVLFDAVSGVLLYSPHEANIPMHMVRPSHFATAPA